VDGINGNLEGRMLLEFCGKRCSWQTLGIKKVMFHAGGNET